MRPEPRILAFMVVLHVLSALMHWVLWRWLRSAVPAFMARHAKGVAAALVILVVLPLGREIGSVWREVPIFGVLAAFASLWHLALIITLAVIGVLRVAGRVGAAISPAHVPERRRAIECVGGAFAFTASNAALGWGALRGRFEWTVEEVPIRLSRLPKALDGFTIVQISDLHVGTFVGERELVTGLELVERSRPDLVVVTGDIVDNDPRYIALAARHLGSLRAREGVACIPGNHDYYTGASVVMEGMRRAGLDVLVNRGKIVAAGDGGLALLGVDDIWANHYPGGLGPDLDAALAMVRPDLATVLLAHQPRFASAASGRGIDLQLSGHTHGGQVNPGFRPIDWFSRYVAGRYDVGAMQLYVNRGFGTVGPPTRVGAPPEITKIVLVAG